MRYAGTESWSISVDQWDHRLDCALWFRTAERIDVRAGGPVTGPPDVDPLPTRSLASSDELTEAWLWWWTTLLGRPSSTTRTTPSSRASLNTFGPPQFEGLADYPALHRVVTARWAEANAWHAARKQGEMAKSTALRGHKVRREGTVVREVEAQAGHKAAPFSLRIIVLPVLDEQIRSAGKHTFLVPAHVHASNAYDDWLRKVVRALA